MPLNDITMKKPINNYPNYEIEDDGRVWSIASNKWLSQRTMKNGYSSVNLWKDGRYKSFLTHRLVAEAFLPNPNNLPQVNHINEDKSDNRVENLEWCSAEYNTNYGTRNGRVAERLAQPVIQCDSSGNEIKRWDSIRSAARELNVFATNIVKCLKGKYKTAGGYEWKYD